MIVILIGKWGLGIYVFKVIEFLDIKNRRWSILGSAWVKITTWLRILPRFHHRFLSIINLLEFNLPYIFINLRSFFNLIWPVSDHSFISLFFIAIFRIIFKLWSLIFLPFKIFSFNYQILFYRLISNNVMLEIWEISIIDFLLVRLIFLILKHFHWCNLFKFFWRYWDLVDCLWMSLSK